MNKKDRLILFTRNCFACVSLFVSKIIGANTGIVLILFDNDQPDETTKKDGLQVFYASNGDIEKVKTACSMTHKDIDRLSRVPDIESKT